MSANSIKSGTVCRIRKFNVQPYIRPVTSDNGDYVANNRVSVKVKTGTVLIVLDRLANRNFSRNFQMYDRSPVGTYFLSLLPDGNIYVVRDTIITSRMR